MVVRRGMLAPAGKRLPVCSRHIGVKMGKAMVKPIKFINAVKATIKRSRLLVCDELMQYSFWCVPGCIQEESARNVLLNKNVV